MAEPGADPATPKPHLIPPLVVPLLAGAVVAVGLGVYGNVHDPTGRSLYTLFFTDTIRLKAWLGTACVALALGQLATATRLRGRLTGGGGRASAPGWLADLHQLLGTLTLGLSLPVAYHCLWALGYQTTTARVAVHSLVGCAFYGAFAAKVMIVRRHDGPAWVVPIAGATTFVVLVGVWWTSSLWFFRTVTWSP